MSTEPQLFGTDGIRGVAGKYPLDRDTVWKVGRAVGEVLGRLASGNSAKVALGEDTRESSAWISQTLAAGLRSAGMEVMYAGVVTTPGVACLTRRHGLTAGVMVSASHNPYQDNGIKVLSRAGTKLSEDVELEIEAVMARCSGPPDHARELRLEPSKQLLEDYLEFLQALVPANLRLSRFRVVLDCANGASSRIAPELLRRLGVQTRVLNAAPNGRNINLGCGSLHPEIMARETCSSGADLGVAFDGDADRAIFALPDGRVADGDHVLFALAPYLLAQGNLKGQAVVGTLMTNLGLEIALAERGIGLKRTPVGDKYVLEEMLRSRINLGGEPSGHIIFSDISLAGDGIITMLEVLALMAGTGEPLAERVRALRLFPQVIRNVRVREKPPLDSLPAVAQTMADCRREFGERGRLVVRYSGTEPLARVMVEAPDAAQVENHAARIVAAIDAALGVK